MRRYEILPHTGDVAILAQGSGREELLQAAIVGMFEASEPKYAKAGGEVQRTFDVKENDFPSLLVAVLNEALFFAGTEHEAYNDVKVTSLVETRAQGILVGRKVTGFDTEIKAATYHGLSVKRKGTVWEALIIFDT